MAEESGNLETRIINQATGHLGTIIEHVNILLGSDAYPRLLGEETYRVLQDQLTKIKTGARDTAKIVQELKGFYSAQEQKTETSEIPIDRSLERRLIHDANNKLTPPVGYSDLILIDKQYAGLLGLEYEDFRSKVIAIQAAANKTVELLIQLGGFYRAQEQGIELVEASTLSPEETIYSIVHIDDDEKVTEDVIKALYENSNVLPSSLGIFGRDGKRVRYRLHSYESVEKALRKIPSLGTIDLLVTDREMPGLDGYALLEDLSKQSDKRSRKPGFKDVKHIAMLTGGITQEEAERAQQTYGITILTKPFQPLQLEQQIYRIINPPI